VQREGVDGDPVVPHAVHAQVSRLLITNCLIGERPRAPGIALEATSFTSVVESYAHIAALGEHLPTRTDAYQLYKLVENDSVASADGELSCARHRRPDAHHSPRNGAMDVWQVHAMPVWAEFVGAPQYYAPSSTPLLVDTPLSAWLVQEGHV